MASGWNATLNRMLEDFAIDSGHLHAPIVLVVLSALSLLAWIMLRPRPLPPHVRRARSLQFTSAATATVRSPQIPRLDFRSPLFREVEQEPTILKDFRRKEQPWYVTQWTHLRLILTS